MKVKKYSLHNSYFKLSRSHNLPDTILEISEYLKKNGELPFKYEGDNWVYDAFVERQKYRGVVNSQYLTPDATADRMLHFAGKYFTQNDVLEPCCGTGQITKELLISDYSTLAFDNDKEMVDICSLVYPSLDVMCLDFKDFEKEYTNQSGYAGMPTHRNQIIANPPYEIPVLTEFLEWIEGIQDCGGISILLLPQYFINKSKPKRTFDILRKFGVLEVEDMSEAFARTNVRAQIVVLKKL
jgi:hypothetical protein